MIDLRNAELVDVFAYILQCQGHTMVLPGSNPKEWYCRPGNPPTEKVPATLKAECMGCIALRKLYLDRNPLVHEHKCKCNAIFECSRKHTKLRFNLLSQAGVIRICPDRGTWKHKKWNQV